MMYGYGGHCCYDPCGYGSPVAGYGYGAPVAGVGYGPGYGCGGRGFALIVVLFILLIIVGASRFGHC